MLKIKINKDKIVEYEHKNGQVSVNGEEFYLDIESIGKNKFNILKNNKAYNAEVLSYNEASKTFLLKINGVIIEAEVKDRLDLMLEDMGLGDKKSESINDLKAPMPGLIADILVSDNQDVESGQPLLILEAMKMENLIKSPGKGQIKSVKVTKGQSVEKNQVLIQFSK